MQCVKRIRKWDVATHFKSREIKKCSIKAKFDPSLFYREELFGGCCQNILFSYKSSDLKG
jgi:hypothetical protein